MLALLAVINLALALIAVPGGVLAQSRHRVAGDDHRTQWSWFANLLNYGIVGGFFVGEYLLRKRRFPGRYRSFVDFLRQDGGAGAGVLARFPALKARLRT